MTKLLDEKHTELFIADLEKQLKKVAARHKIKIPGFNAFEVDGAIFLNITAFKKSPEDVFAFWFNQNCDKVGLDKEMLRKKFFHVGTGTYYSIIGLDPDGGENCIRVRDSAGNDHHMHPQVIKTSQFV